jgi:hypothetical protein
MSSLRMDSSGSMGRRGGWGKRRGGLSRAADRHGGSSHETRSFPVRVSLD